MKKVKNLGNLRWANSLPSLLGLEPLPRPSSAREPRPVGTHHMYTVAVPDPIKNPRLVSVSPDFARAVGLCDDGGVQNAPDSCLAALRASRENGTLVEELCGNVVPDGSEPVAHCYAGFQFGNFSGQLGDGRAMSLGEIVTPRGDDPEHGATEMSLFRAGRSEPGPEGTVVELQWKGSGLTPFSRSADGRAVLRSSVREYLASEAMHALGVPTTRALSLVTSDSRVLRDPLYDGRVVMERASVVVRAAPCFVRFGSFEVFLPTHPRTGRAGPKADLGAATARDVLLKMVEAVVARHFPEIDLGDRDAGGDGGGDGGGRATPLVVAYLDAIARRTARMVAAWQGVGFCHGVLNTDNMSAVGVTIDYGPFGFLDHTNPDHICNHSDDGGRYAFSRQPSVCRWNVERLALALDPVAPKADTVPAALKAYDEELDRAMDLTFLGNKLGLGGGPWPEADRAILRDVRALLEQHAADWTITWRAVANLADAVAASAADGGGDGDGDGVGAAAAAVARFTERVARHCAPPGRRAKMVASRYSPAALESAITRLREDVSLRAAADPREIAMIELEWSKVQRARELEARDPKGAATAARDAFKAWAARYAARVAADEDPCALARRALRSNPRVVLRNWIAEEAIEAADRGDDEHFARVLAVLRTPFDEPAPGTATSPEDGGDWQRAIELPPPDRYADLCVSCSS